MTPKQRELVSKYLSDLSKGVLLAVVVGVQTGKVSLGYVCWALLVAGAMFWAAYLLEGVTHNAQQ